VICLGASARSCNLQLHHRTRANQSPVTIVLAPPGSGLKMATAPRFPAGNSPITERGTRFGRKTIPVGAGGDGDGNPFSEPDPRKPAPLRAYRSVGVAGFRSVQIGPRRPSSGSSIYTKSNPNPSTSQPPRPPQPLPQPLEHQARRHQQLRLIRAMRSATVSLRRPSPHAPPWLVAGSVLPAARPDRGHGPDAGDQPGSHTSSSRWRLQSTARCFNL